MCWRLGSDPGGHRAGDQASKDNVDSTATLQQFSFSTVLQGCADVQVLLSIWFIFLGYKKYKKKNFTDGKLNTKVKLTKKIKSTVNAKQKHELTEVVSVSEMANDPLQPMFKRVSIKCTQSCN